MASAVEICNKALTLLGNKPIVALTDDTKAGRAVNRVFDPTRLLMLQGHPWNFASKRASIAASPTAPIFGFDRAFPVPNDALFIKEISAVEAFKVESGNINTDATAPLEVIYIADLTDPDQMTPLFREALAARIALDIGFDMTGNATLLTTLKAIYDERLSGARTNDAQEGTPDLVEQGTWLDSRF